MNALLKITQIQEPSSSTVNITLDLSGNTTINGAITANLAVDSQFEAYKATHT